jgi:DNA topoisomerase-1
MVIKWGRHGSFLACSGYPDCKNTRELSKEMAAATGTETAAPTPEISSQEEFCDICGKPMVLKRGRFGMFFACTGYPECTGKKSIRADGVKRTPPKPIGEKCELCGGELVIRTSRAGEFIGCSNYPKCKFTRSIPTGIKCPKCTTGDIVQRTGGKSKRSFWGCSRYPECDFISNAKPENKACPSCNNNYVVHKWTKTKEERLMCPACKSEFTLELAPVEEEVV